MSALLANKFASSSGVKSETMSNQELPKEFHKPIIKKIEKGKIFSSFEGKRISIFTISYWYLK